MADEIRNFCVKCDENIGDAAQAKILKCNGQCNKVIHQTCSSYNASEWQFLETNKDNIKWFCDGCSQATTVKVSQ
ncbi:unnamed protein product [Phaedon cochleariae]|uniref:PHD-type domain-containing protein n=1 Tax=Phaedon cochleariae TaxID=80249 RepID=A0A9P0GLK7_PHACE|nr:unnamed protein product [Phaedon cochleariae]